MIVVTPNLLTKKRRSEGYSPNPSTVKGRGKNRSGDFVLNASLQASKINHSLTTPENRMSDVESCDFAKQASIGHKAGIDCPQSPEHFCNQKRRDKLYHRSSSIDAVRYRGNGAPVSPGSPHADQLKMCKATLRSAVSSST